jgi:hypothetical protein
MRWAWVEVASILSPPLGRKVLEFLQLEKKQLNEIKTSVNGSFEEIFHMFYG